MLDVSLAFVSAGLENFAVVLGRQVASEQADGGEVDRAVSQQTDNHRKALCRARSLDASVRRVLERQRTCVQ